MTTMKSWRRRAIGLALATTAVLLSSFVASPAAQAHDGAILCTLGTAHQRFEPVLPAIPAQVTVHEEGHISGCTSANHPDIVAADYSYEGQGQLSCITGGSSSGTYMFHWKDAQGHPEGTTIVDFAIVSVGVRPDGQQVLVGIGDVTGGTHFNPGHLVYDEVLLADPLDCLFGGVEEQFGVNVGMLIA